MILKFLEVQNVSHSINCFWGSWVIYDNQQITSQTTKIKILEVRLQFGNCVHESAHSFQYPQNSDRAWKEIKIGLLDASLSCWWAKVYDLSYSKRDFINLRTWRLRQWKEHLWTCHWVSFFQLAYFKTFKRYIY